MEPGRVSDRKGATVLVVDDEPYVRSALARTLRRSVGCILLAAGAEEAERLTDRHGVDLVLADHGLPGTTGLELLHRLQARGLRAHRLLITGHAEDALEPAALRRAGIVRLLAKPWDPAGLRKLVEALLEGRDDVAGGAVPGAIAAGSAADAWLLQARAELAAATGERLAIDLACRALARVAGGAEVSFFDERSEALRVLPPAARGADAPFAWRPLDALDDDEVAALAHARAAGTPIALRRASRRGLARTALLARVRGDGRTLGVLQLVSGEAVHERTDLLVRLAALATALGARLARDAVLRHGGAAA